MKKTNALRFLEKQGIPFTLRSYEVDPDNVGADYVAAQIGIPIERACKTLATRADRETVLLAGLPGHAELDRKKLAALSGHKKVEMLPLREVEQVTGYIRGGVSPIGCKRVFPVYLEASLLQHETICVSAGRRGLQIVLAPQALVDLLGAITGDICKSAGAAQ
ncbi:MAG: Cys-tRNA(Pro) deacylase [Synergistales bacterium]|nr:Cys-tRNA(Pro) deacylase [Synergistales bacterium]